MAEDSAAAIAALRAQGAARREPLRFHHVDALARRTAAQAGAVRQLLEPRLAAALADLQRRLAAAPGVAAGPAAGKAGPGPLATLLQHGPGHAASSTGAPTELKAVHQFGNTWARLRVDQQLVRSQARQPENAGPLNSQRLMLQTLQQLRSLSPAYLQRFMAHADALLWLEHSAGAGQPPSGSAGSPGTAGAPGRSDGERRRKAGRQPR